MLQERAGAGLHEHIAGEVAAGFPDRGLSIVDVGCGTGAFLQRLARLGYRTLQGVDIAPPAVPPGGTVQFHAADVDSGHLPIATASCDLAILIEFIEHVENPGLVLAELARIVRPGGSVLLTTPNSHSIEARLRWLLTERLKQFDELGDPTHVTPVFLFPFLRLCGRHGFSPRRQWGHPTDGSSPTSRPLLRVLARLAGLGGLRARIPGDHLCLLLDRESHDDQSRLARKADMLTGHYATR